MAFSEVQAKFSIDLLNFFLNDEGSLKDYRELENSRNLAITSIRNEIDNYLAGKSNLKSFKSTIDSLNKKNKYWGFSGYSGQMFFNLLFNVSPDSAWREGLENSLREAIKAPSNLPDSREKMDEFYKSIAPVLSLKGIQRQQGLNFGYIPLFLSYFWQIQDPEKFPVYYTDSVVSVMVSGNLLQNTLVNPIDIGKRYEEYCKIYKELMELYQNERPNLKVTYWMIESIFYNQSQCNAIRYKEGYKALQDKLNSWAPEKLDKTLMNEKEVIGKYSQVFNSANIEKLTLEEFLGFLSENNNKHWSDLLRQTSNITENWTLNKQALSILLNDNNGIGIYDRLNSAYENSKGLGPAILTAVLLITYPTKCCVLNGRSFSALRNLKLLELNSGPSTNLKKYKEINKVALCLSRNLSIDLWTLDSLLGELGKEEDSELIAPLTDSQPQEALSVNDTRSESVETQDTNVSYGEALDEPTNYLLLRYSEEMDHRWRDELGNRYHFGKISNYAKLRKGSKAVWFDKRGGRYYFWGYGDVDKVVSESDGDYFAIFENFVSFNPQKESTEQLQDEITRTPGYNFQYSILEISFQIYNEIVSSKVLMIFADEQLPNLSNEDLTLGYEKLSNELLVPKEKATEIVMALESGRHVLIAGPIGTGKTQLAKLIPEIFWEKVGGYHSEDHTATADWSTQDVIGGIFPKMDDNKPIYEIQYGCVVETVRKNWQYGVDGGLRVPTAVPSRDHPYRGTWLILDEFNRADIDKAFGQLFTSLRTKMLKLPSSKKDETYKELKIPEDYRIIGTLNTADKHYLFQLSDALKSRFAFIELGIPDPSAYENEIYYAIRNAVLDLNKNYDSLVLLNDDTKTIDRENSNQRFITITYQAYYFLSVVRVFKKLGTGVLKLIYQSMLTGSAMGLEPKVVLDNALTSNLIPQLENLPLTSTEAILALYSDGIIKYFKDAYKSPNRQSYENAFSKIVNYLEVSSAKNIIADFDKGELKVDDDATWQPVETAYNARKERFATDLDQLKQSMRDLIETMVI